MVPPVMAERQLVGRRAERFGEELVAQADAEDGNAPEEVGHDGNVSRQGGGVRETFSVRKISFGVGVERTFPVHSPIIAKIEVVSRGDVRRAKLYYLRDRIGKAAKIKEKRF